MLARRISAPVAIAVAVPAVVVPPPLLRQVLAQRELARRLDGADVGAREGGGRGAVELVVGDGGLGLRANGGGGGGGWGRGGC